MRPLKESIFSGLPKSHVPVVVCRLAGIRTRGRSLVSKKPAAGANRRTPPNGGRDLKQRRTGLFRLCWPSKGWRTEEACLSCRTCGRELIPSIRWPLNPLDSVMLVWGGRVLRRSTRPVLSWLKWFSQRVQVTDVCSSASASPTRGEECSHPRSQLVSAR